MPTSPANDEEFKEIYEEVKEIIQTIKGEENFIMMGDWNSVLRKGRDGKIVGIYIYMHWVKGMKEEAAW